MGDQRQLSEYSPTFEGEKYDNPRPRNGRSFDTTDEPPHVRRTPTPDENGPIEGRYLSAEEIFLIDDIEQRETWVPEWRSHVILQTLNGAERDKYFASIQYIDKRGRQLVENKESNAKLLVLAARTPDGAHLFTIHQVKRLQEKNSGVIARLAKIAGEMNGFGQDEDDDRERRQGLD